MTFITNSYTHTDSNNSITSGTNTFTGTGTLVSGYETVTIVIQAYNENSTSQGLQIQFSPDDISYNTIYTDTYFQGLQYKKSFDIVDKYYKLIYDSSGNTEYNIRTILNVQQANNSFYDNNEHLFDAFSKLRVTNPQTLLDITFPMETVATTEFLTNNYFINYKSDTTGGGTISTTFGGAKCIIDISGGGSDTTRYITQSRKSCIYQPGKSLLFLGSGKISDTLNTSTDFSARIGYFNGVNGLFFAYDQNGISVNLINSSSITQIMQSDWNIDKMNGTGTSKINLNFNKCQLFVIDFEWLSVGKIRFGFYAYGKIVYCHTIHNVNQLNGPYMETANLPVRYELRVNDSGRAYLTQICSSVISEGGYNPLGRPFSFASGTTAISINTTETPLMAIRGNTEAASSSNNKYGNQTIIPSSYVIFGSSNTIFLYRVKLYLAPNTPVISSWTNVDNNSVVQCATGTDIDISNQPYILIDSGCAKGKVEPIFKNFASIFTSFIQLGANIDGDTDVILITAETVSGSDNIYTSINWSEIT